MLCCLTVVGGLSPVASGEFFFEGLGDLPGGAFESRANGISADGSTVVGLASTRRPGGSLSVEAVYWTVGAGMTLIHRGNLFNTAIGASGDGSAVCGYSDAGQSFSPWTWRSDGSGQVLDEPPGILSTTASGISDDGQTVVGSVFDRTNAAESAYRWRGNGPEQIASSLEKAVANGVSGNGQVFVGRGRGPGIAGEQAWLWTDGGLQMAGFLPGAPENFSEAMAVNFDGGVLVGRAASPRASANRREAFRWTATTGMVPLGDLPGGEFDSLALDVSDDGSVIVGSSRTDGGNSAVVWIDGRIHELSAVLGDLGIDVSNWRLRQVTGVSADGRTIVGYGRNPNGDTEAFVATIPEPASGAAFAGMLLLALSVRTRTHC